MSVSTLVVLPGGWGAGGCSAWLPPASAAWARGSVPSARPVLGAAGGIRPLVAVTVTVPVSGGRGDRGAPVVGVCQWSGCSGGWGGRGAPVVGVLRFLGCSGVQGAPVFRVLHLCFSLGVMLVLLQPSGPALVAVLMLERVSAGPGLFLLFQDALQKPGEKRQENNRPPVRDTEEIHAARLGAAEQPALRRGQRGRDLRLGAPCAGREVVGAGGGCSRSSLGQLSAVTVQGAGAGASLRTALPLVTSGCPQQPASSHPLVGGSKLRYCCVRN